MAAPGDADVVARDGAGIVCCAVGAELSPGATAVAAGASSDPPDAGAPIWRGESLRGAAVSVAADAGDSIDGVNVEPPSAAITDTP